MIVIVIFALKYSRFNAVYHSGEENARENWKCDGKSASHQKRGNGFPRRRCAPPRNDRGLGHLQGMFPGRNINPLSLRGPPAARGNPRPLFNVPLRGDGIRSPRPFGAPPFPKRGQCRGAATCLPLRKGGAERSEAEGSKSRSAGGTIFPRHCEEAQRASAAIRAPIKGERIPTSKTRNARPPLRGGSPRAMMLPGMTVAFGFLKGCFRSAD